MRGVGYFREVGDFSDVSDFRDLSEGAKSITNNSFSEEQSSSKV